MGNRRLTDKIILHGMIALMVCAGWPCLIMPAAAAMVRYYPATGVLLVEDFPEILPCTPMVLERADRMNGWGVVARDMTTGAYRVNASLQIGTHRGMDTFFQLGDAVQTNVRLEIHGDLIVAPYYVPGASPEPTWKLAPVRVNRFSMGMESNPAIRATLAIYADQQQKNSIYVGCLPPPQGRVVDGTGGEFCVYHGRITAAVPDMEHAFGGPDANRTVHMRGARHVFKHAEISWWAGFFGYGMMRRNTIVENTVFEHGASALVNGNLLIKKCVFRNLDTAFRDYGGLDYEAYDCVFENNQHNWAVRFTDKGVRLVDCQVGAPVKGDIYERYVRDGRTNYPRAVFMQRTSLRVKDADGRPVSGAHARIYNKIADETISLKIEASDAGLDLVLARYELHASDVLNKPDRVDYSYAIVVTAPRFRNLELPDWRPADGEKELTLTMDGGQ